MQEQRNDRFINYILYVGSVIGLVVTVMWLLDEEESWYEPTITFIASIIALIAALFKKDNDGKRDIQRLRHWLVDEYGWLNISLLFILLFSLSTLALGYSQKLYDSVLLISMMSVVSSVLYIFSFVSKSRNVQVRLDEKSSRIDTLLQEIETLEQHYTDWSEKIIRLFTVTDVVRFYETLSRNEGILSAEQFEDYVTQLLREMRLTLSPGDDPNVKGATFLVFSEDRGNFELCAGVNHREISNDVKSLTLENSFAGYVMNNVSGCHLWPSVEAIEDEVNWYSLPSVEADGYISCLATRVTTSEGQSIGVLCFDMKQSKEVFLKLEVRIMLAVSDSIAALWEHMA